MLKEFKEFAVKGNVLDLAVAVIMGNAFSPIVNSLVNDVIMPPIGAVLSRVDFKELYVSLSRQSFPTLAAAKAAGVAVIAYGNFVNTVINFLIVAFVMFLLVRQINRLHKPQPAAAPVARECPYCFNQIPIRAIRCPHCTSQLAPA